MQISLSQVAITRALIAAQELQCADEIQAGLLQAQTVIQELTQYATLRTEAEYIKHTDNNLVAASAVLDSAVERLETRLLQVISI